MTNYRLSLYAAVLSGVIALYGGCATKDYVNKQLTNLEKKVMTKIEDTQRNVSELERNVERIRTKSNVEAPVIVTKGHKEFNKLKDLVVSKYQDPESKSIAEKYADMITLLPTNDRKLYYAVVMVDKDNNAKATHGDRTLPDKIGEKQIILIPLPEEELTHEAIELLLNVRSVDQK
mgnify:CR=1 FL=1